MSDLKIKDKRVLSIQDISCFGKCSLTLALPIISACGIETDILPSAVLSTHTGGFKNPFVRDLTEDMPHIKEHWLSAGLGFDLIYVGYLGNKKQIDYVADIFKSLLNEGGLKVLDPVMADHGKLYKGFDMEYVEKMKILCKSADILTPNITEACLLTDIAYKEEYDKRYINSLIEKLAELTSGSIILKGIREGDKVSVAIKKGKNFFYKSSEEIIYISKKWIDASCYGTGDIFISATIGAFLRNKSLEKAVELAMDYVCASIKATLKDKAHWYGVKFEKELYNFIKKL